jgi:hypothetical protein
MRRLAYLFWLITGWVQASDDHWNCCQLKKEGRKLPAFCALYATDSFRCFFIERFWNEKEKAAQVSRRKNQLFQTQLKLKIGERKNFKGQDFSLELTQISDARCPSGAFCDQTGEGVAFFRYTGEGEDLNFDLKLTDATQASKTIHHKNFILMQIVGSQEAEVKIQTLD